MKFICNKNDLKTNLSLVSRAVPSRPTHPVLGNVLLIADANLATVSLTGYDLNLGIVTSFGAEVIEGGSITVPAKLFNDIISRFPDAEITVESEEQEPTEDEEKGGTLYLKANTSKLSLRTISANNYPSLPEVANGEPLMLPPATLIEGLKNVTFAASTEEIKQVLTGVHLKGSKEGIEFAATDGHRLAVVTTFFEDAKNTKAEDEDSDIDEDSANFVNPEFELTIPARSLRELEKILASHSGNEQVAIYTDDNVVIFEVANQRLTSRLLDGPYPAYERMVPQEFTRTMTSDRKRLISALELVSVLYNQKNNLVKFSLDSINQEVTLSVEAKELGSAKESLLSQITGDSIDVGFNGKYLMEGLKIIDTNDVQMQLNENNKPIIFSPLGGPKMIYLVMPVQIRD